MRILEIGGLAGPGPVAGGVWRVAETQAALLRQRGHEVHLFGLWLEENPPTAGDTHYLPARPPFPGAGLRGLVTRDLKQRLQDFGPYDVAHVHLARDYFTTQALRIITDMGIPVVVQTHGMISPAKKRSTAAFDRLFKSSMVKRPTEWLALTDVEEADLRAFGAQNIVRVDNPVLPTGMTWSPNPERYFLFASRLHERKQADVFVRAGLKALESCPDMRFVIAGPDEGHAAVVKSIIDGSPFADRFQMTGPLDQEALRHKLAGAHGMVLPSRAEVAPMIVIESCEIGTPVILTDDCGLSAGLAAAESAIITAPEDAPLARAMVRLWNDPELAQALSRRGQDYYSSHWSPGRVGEELEEIYNRATGTGTQIRDRNTMSPASRIPITVLVQTKNEAIGIAACIDSLGDFDEVIVADSNSTDATKQIAEEHGAKVVNFDWDHKYPKKKQWMIEQAGARNDWLLLMDADERVTPAMLEELRAREAEMAAGTYGAYEIPIDYVFNGRLLQHGHKVYKRTLVDRRVTTYPAVDDLDAPGMGELEGHYQPLIAGKIGTFEAPIHHDDQDPIRSWFDRHNRYSDWEAYLVVHPELKNQVDRLRTGNGQKFAKVPFKPLAFFVYDYVVKQGFRDGREGFNYAFALSWYYWLTDVKIREARASQLSNK